MTEVRQEIQTGPPLRYTTHKHLRNQNLKIRISRLLDDNHILRTQDKPLDSTNNQILITCQVYANEKPVTPPRTTKLIRKVTLIDEDIELPVKVSHLNYNAIISITIWSLDKKFEEDKPIGSTIISIFDSNLKLREGKFNLLIWPDRLPDTSIDSTTPGLVTDPNIDDLNFYNKRLEHFERNAIDQTSLNNKALQALRNQQFYGYRKVPAAFLEIVFPLCDVPVLYEDVDFFLDASIGSKETPKIQYYLETSSFSNSLIFGDYDVDNERSNPVHDYFVQTVRYEGDDVTALKPNLDEIEKINKILFKPIFGQISQEDKNLIWKFRYYLRENKGALLKFLHCVNWSLEKESKEALSLLDKWAKIDYEDALHLLSSFFCANETYNKSKKPLNTMLKIREYALKILSEVSNERISFILLQLVQGLRYEQLNEDSPLLNFLIKKAQRDEYMATNLYWHLQVEVSFNSGAIGEFYQMALRKFIEALHEDQETMKIYKMLQHQEDFRQYLIMVNTKVKKAGKGTKKTEELRKILKEGGGVLTPHRFALEPNIFIDNFIPDSCIAFKSAMAPLLLSMNAHKEDINGMASDRFVYKVIFKNGDDLRQDQLILQIIALMNSLLKSINLDLKLTPYRALACGKEDGYLEFCPNSKTIQDILKENNDAMDNFFKKLADTAVSDPNSWFYKKHVNNDEKLKAITDKEALAKVAYNLVMDNYIDSCAGYCVITYILGIGDRHLENLMMNNEGKFFHIDFGFILGRDPKIQPPPFKLSKQMVECMKKDDYYYYEKFRKRCVAVYQYLRNYSKLIINLFNLMLDSGLPHVDEKGLDRLWERFRLDETNEQVEKTIITLIDEAVDAVLPVFFDKLHSIVSQNFR